ncbi:hypothetical protein D0B54_03700 [Solimonas sp. K1W22B-7]|uniref:hypothetical protein n=1 Tax=Solimonas sp. K1W22B-7 TaxID=2303331 RepID=UPI000E331EEB|nr:hypothetical protein [Solimonas sp. K1W22B-7]AXQ27833.1 hypothetical protein D0B54_03700 [Solimonas sp. K1W22B-7]
MLPHFPVAKETLDKSVVARRCAPARAVDCQGGYGMWKEAFDAGKGDVFTISVAEIVSVRGQAIAAQPPH